MKPIPADPLPPPGGHYSPAIEADGWIFVSGQLPVGPGGRLPADSPFEEQVKQVLANLQTILGNAGAGLDDIVKVTAYIVGGEHWAAFNRVYAEVFGAHRPARTVVPVAELHYGMAVEVDAIARRA